VIGAVNAVAAVEVAAGVIAGRFCNSLPLNPKKGALGRSAPFFIVNFALSNRTSLAPMEKLAVDELRLVDLRGKPVKLSECFEKYVLLIFLRHLA
jgi:hypothetical protein